VSNHPARRAFLGISHSPLIGLNALPAEVETDLQTALRTTTELVRAWRPDLVILLGPDHYNGFFHELMPPYCIGSQASSVGDYLCPSGPLNVDGDAALALAEHLLTEGFDAAVSRRMRVDHGFVQALQVLWGGLDTPPIVPIFVNAVARPSILRLARCEQLGRALGRFVDRLPGRTLLIGSGGLSHEPPVPTLEHPDPAVRERLIARGVATAEERAAKTQRVMAAGRDFAAGRALLKPLNARWDLHWMDALARGDFAPLTGLSEDSIDREAGTSAHESKAWLIARAALPAKRLPVVFRYHRLIPELIAGFGVLWIHDGAAE
jgi:2,3-dihydroxyphenylpropionate 1,2-dioxygenase